MNYVNIIIIIIIIIPARELDLKSSTKLRDVGTTTLETCYVN